jgi:hypothetical protein
MGRAVGGSSERQQQEGSRRASQTGGFSIHCSAHPSIHRFTALAMLRVADTTPCAPSWSVAVLPEEPRSSLRLAGSP